MLASNIFDGLRMHVVETASNGVVNADTYFDFTESDGVISARYGGGGVRLGHLVGKVVDGRLHFRYAQITHDGQLDGGKSVCDIEYLEDGRLRLLEHFKWESRPGNGVNVFEQVA